MKLLISTTSPYSRKVRVALIELNLEERVEIILDPPFNDSPSLHSANPLGKVPALILEDGRSLFDSALICRYLDSLSGQTLLPQPDDWTRLRGEALADGMTDAAFNLVIEKLRPDAEQSQKWKRRWENAIHRALENIEVNIMELTAIDLEGITTAVALAYLNFRLPGFLDNYPKCSTWLAQFEARESMKATRFGV